MIDQLLQEPILRYGKQNGLAAADWTVGFLFMLEGIGINRLGPVVHPTTNQNLTISSVPLNLVAVLGMQVCDMYMYIYIYSHIVLEIRRTRRRDLERFVTAAR